MPFSWNQTGSRAPDLVNVSASHVRWTRTGDPCERTHDQAKHADLLVSIPPVRWQRVPRRTHSQGLEGL